MPPGIRDGTRGGIQTVASPDVGGVRMRRHPLECEAGRLNHLARRVGQRLMNWIRQTPEQVQAVRTVGEFPNVTTVPVYNDDGTPVMVPYLPDEDFRENWKLYEKTVRGLLQEQRARAAMAPGKGGPAVDDATFNAQLEQLAANALEQMPADKLRELVARRGMTPPEPDPDEPDVIEALGSEKP